MVETLSRPSRSRDLRTASVCLRVHRHENLHSAVRPIPDASKRIWKLQGPLQVHSRDNLEIFEQNFRVMLARLFVCWFGYRSQ